MSHDPQLNALLKQWEEHRQRGQIVTVEELCRYCPELVSALARRIDVLQAQSSELVNTISEATEPSSVPSDEASSFGGAGYQIIGELGRGGMGIVYEAFDRKRRRTVALKTFRNIDSSALYRFKQEFRALADVTHPNLVPLFELISDGNTWFFTMELIQGINFLNHVCADAPRPSQIARIRDAFRQLAEGIVALHDAGKLHRDIKPSNVMVTREGRLVLLDFGLAADLEATGAYQSADEHVVGTAAYMAPEQAMGEPVSPASDWYSVGVMLYETLAGRRPFVGPRSAVLLEKQCVDPPAPCELAPDIPDDLNALCVELLRRRPEHRPAGRDVIRRLRYEPAPAAAGPPPPLRTPFVGREQHLTALHDAFLTTRQGQAVTLFLQGRSGQGKSALVQRFFAGLHEHDDAVVLAGRCYERESVPYKAMDSLVDNLSHYLACLPRLEAAALLPRDVLALARVFPVLRQIPAVAEAPPGPIDTPDPQELRRRAFTALRELLARLGRRRPLVLFIDDLQWGDADSALLLSELLRPPDAPVLLFLGSFRSEDAATSPLLRLLLQPSAKTASPFDRRELIVDVLTFAEARELALMWLGEDSVGARAHADAIAAESGGNPLFLGELVRSYQAASGPEQPALGAEIVLGEVLWARIERLPPEARNLLEILAVAGRPLPQATAARAAGLEGEERTLLGMLRTGHLVRGTGSADLDEVETYHDRIRETVVAHLPAATLMLRHGRLANTLETLGHPDPETLAVHFLGATERGKAGHYYALAAAKAAEALAFDRSANLYRVSLELRPVAEAETRDLRTRLGDALANAGRGAEAAHEYETAAAAAPVPEALDLKRRAAYQYLISGHFDAGCAAIDTVLRAVGMTLPATPLRALGSLLWRRAWLRLRGLRFRERAPAAQTPAERTRLDICSSTSTGLGVIDIIRGADFQTRCLLLALRAGDAFHIARSLALEAIFNAAGGGRTRQRTTMLLAAATELAARIRKPYIDAVVRMAHGAVAFLEGRFPHALVCLVEADEIFRNQCTGVAWEIDTSLTHRVVTLVLTGQIGELNRLGPFRLRDAQERGDLYAATNLGAYVMPLLRLAADDPDGARAVVNQAMAQWSQKGFHLQHLFALLSETEICLYQGQGLAAWNHLSTRWPAYIRSQLTHIQVSHFQALFARARSAVAASAGATNPRPFWTAAQRDARALERAGMPWSLALAGLIRAGLSGVQGDRRSACEQLARVIAPLERLHGQLYAAAARWCLGRLQGGAAGCSLQAQAEAWMTAEQIRNPARMACTVLPGISAESA